MDWQTWQTMPESERAKHRDNSDLNPQLESLRGARVEAVTHYGETRRFWVGKSTGWKPINLEVKTRRSLGGEAAEKSYKSIKLLYWK